MMAIKVVLTLVATLDTGHVVQSGQVRGVEGADDAPRESGALGHVLFHCGDASVAQTQL